MTDDLGFFFLTTFISFLSPEWTQQQVLKIHKNSISVQSRAI